MLYFSNSELYSHCLKTDREYIPTYKYNRSTGNIYLCVSQKMSAVPVYLFLFWWELVCLILYVQFMSNTCFSDYYTVAITCLCTILSVRMNTPQRINTAQYNQCWYIKLGIQGVKICLCPLLLIALSEIRQARCEITFFSEIILIIWYKKIIPV